MVAARKTAESDRPRRPAAKTPEARELQVVSKAYDLAEKQMEEGTASAAVITHFLKLGTIERQVQLEKTRNEARLLEAKIENMASAARVEELYDKAIQSMRIYAGHDVDEDPFDEPY